MEFIIIIIALALIFDYINGFHDAANSIATIVSTKVLTPFQAVLWAALFNFAAFLIFKDHAVANTISKTVQKEFITLPVIFSGLIAAIIWNLLTWWWGIPSSSSHTLIGGFAGAAITHALVQHSGVPLSEIIDSPKVIKTVIFIFVAPLLGMVISMFFTLVMINRNTWIKSGILLLACVAVWFTFIRFQEKKMDENMYKFFNVDKYEKAVKHGGTEKDLAKLQKAEADARATFPYIHYYERDGIETVVNNIVKNVDLEDATTSKIEDNLKLFFKVDQLKILSRKDFRYTSSAEQAAAAVDSLKPIAKRHKELGYDRMVTEMLAKVHVPKEHIREFNNAVRVDIKPLLSKSIARGDNKLIRYGLIVILLLIALSFIVTEKIRESSAFRTANNFKRLQLLSSAAFSIGHGGNDAQKVMGIIAAALIANGDIPDIKAMPDWVPLSCYAAISLGTLSGGWRIIKTMGTKITKVTPLEGVCAETAGATTLFLTEQMGIPVSTTHTITGSIIGVGATKRISAVRWGVTINLLWAWILTIPVSALLAAFVYFIVQLFL